MYYELLCKHHVIHIMVVDVCSVYRHMLAYMKECLEDPLSQDDDPLEEMEQTRKSAEYEYE